MKNGKWIIGLTGNIATGKSVVRRMLMNHGALGIDADLIAHRVLYPGGSAYQPVVEAFGYEILDPQGNIDREKLAAIVFDQPKALQKLEALSHPAVTDAIQRRIAASAVPVVVIEAIKLLESPLAALCDSIWISHVSEEVQLERLLHNRKMDLAAARQRIAVQPPQSEKLKRANMVIHTGGTFLATWEQTQQGLRDTIQLNNPAEALTFNIDKTWRAIFPGWLSKLPMEAAWAALTGETPEKLYGALAFDANLALVSAQGVIGWLTWEHWNFTDRIKGIWSEVVSRSEIRSGLQAFIRAAQRWQSELLIAAGPLATMHGALFQELGFTPSLPELVAYPAWSQAIQKIEPDSWQRVWIRHLEQPLESVDPSQGEQRY